jgi:hypothetical protein
MISAVYVCLIFNAIYEFPLVREPQDLVPILYIARHGTIDPSAHPFFKETVTPPLFNAILLLITGTPYLDYMSLYSRLIFTVLHSLLIFLTIRKLGLPPAASMVGVIYSRVLDFQVHDVVGRCVYALLLYLLIVYMMLAKIKGFPNEAFGYSVTLIPVVISLGLSDPAFPVILGISFLVGYPALELILSKFRSRQVTFTIARCGLLVSVVFLAWMAFSCPHLAHLLRYVYDRVVVAFTQYEPTTYHPSLAPIYTSEVKPWLYARLVFYIVNALIIGLSIIAWLLRRDLRERLSGYDAKYLLSLLLPSAFALFIALYRLTYVPLASIALLYFTCPIFNSKRRILSFIKGLIIALIVVNLAFFTPITLILPGGSIGFSKNEQNMAIWFSDHASPEGKSGILIAGKLPTYVKWIELFSEKREKLEIIPYVLVKNVPSTRHIEVHEVKGYDLVITSRNMLTLGWTWKVQPGLSYAIELMQRVLSDTHNRVYDSGYLYNVYHA